MTGKEMHALGEWLTPRQYAEVVTRVTGKSARAEDLSHETFHSEEYRNAITDEFWLTYVISRDVLLMQS